MGLELPVVIESGLGGYRIEIVNTKARHKVPQKRTIVSELVLLTKLLAEPHLSILVKDCPFTLHSRIHSTHINKKFRASIQRYCFLLLLRIRMTNRTLVIIPFNKNITVLCLI